MSRGVERACGSNVPLCSLSFLFQLFSSIVSTVSACQKGYAFGVPPSRVLTVAQVHDIPWYSALNMYGTHLREEPLFRLDY